MGHPLVSVIIPAYNAAATAPRAVESVLAQTYPDWEIIVVDDGSLDNLEAALGSHLGAVQLVRQSRGGAGLARNTGAKLAKGEFLAFLDADDYWHPTKLELQVEAFRRRPETTLCGTQSIPPLSAIPDLAQYLGRIDDSGAIYLSEFERFFLNPYIGTPGVMLPRMLFLELGGFRTDLKSAEDVDLWLRASYGGLVALIPTPLYTITSSPNSLTALHQDGTYRDNLRVVEDFCKAHPQFTREHSQSVRKIKAQILANWGSDAFLRGEMPLAQRVLVRSLACRISFRGILLFAKTILSRLSR